MNTIIIFFSQNVGQAEYEGNGGGEDLPLFHAGLLAE